MFLLFEIFVRNRENRVTVCDEIMCDCRCDWDTCHERRIRYAIPENEILFLHGSSMWHSEI